MPRPALQQSKYTLVRRSGRNNWYITHTIPGTSRNKYISTGVALRWPNGKGKGEPDPPCEQAQAFLEAFIESQESDDLNDATISCLLDERKDYWETKRQRSKREQGRIRAMHKWLKAFFGDKYAEDITPALVTKYHKYREEKSPRDAKPITAIRRELEELTSTLILAKKNRRIEEVPQIEKPARTFPREIYMSPEQGQHYLKVAKTSNKVSYHVRIFVLIACATGRRMGAILDLHKDRVYQKSNILDFNNPDIQESNKRRGTCKISPKVMKEVWKACKLSISGYPVERRGKKIADIRRGLAVLAKEAGMPWVTAHVIKHSVISWLAMAGKQQDEIADFTDTDQATVKRIYRKFSPEYLTPVSDTLTAIILKEPPQDVDLSPQQGIYTPTGRVNSEENGASDGI